MMTLRELRNRLDVTLKSVAAEVDTLIGVKAAGDLDSIRSEYRKTIRAAIDDFLTSENKVTAYQSTMKRATVEAMYDAFWRGYEDSGGDRDEADPADQNYLNGETEAQLTFIGQLFQNLKELRAQYLAGEIKIGDLRDTAAARVDGYTGNLDATYNAGRMRGLGNKKLTWRLGQTEKHCRRCLALDGTTHTAKYYISHDYIPRKPGAAMDCGGYHCDCRLEDSEGHEVTI